VKLKSRHFLKRRDVEEIASSLKNTFGDEIMSLLSDVEVAETEENYDLILCGGKPYFFLVDGKPFPTLRGVLELKSGGREVIVDSGAIRYIAGGADVMCPGIVSADPEIRKGDLVIVREEKHKKPLAIGFALLPGKEMSGRGKAVKTIHHVGDKLWRIFETL
jgi:PUA domain protein